MPRPIDDLIGSDLYDLDTPALWVDLDLMEENIRRLSSYFNETGVAWRPHTKGIKIPAIAHKLLEARAIGITCAKLSEAEVMAAGGIQDILIAHQVVGEQKVRRLVNLRKQTNIMVALDDLQNANQISKIAGANHVRIRVLIELDTGMNRSGLEPGPAVVEFARQLSHMQGIEFMGLMAWEGHVVGIQDSAEKEVAAEKAVLSLVNSAHLCRAAGFETPIVSCGGTGSYQITSRIPGVTEVQAGGGVFGDLTYRKWGADVECSLFVLATITSHTQPGRAVINAGRKTMNTEYTMPEVKDLPGMRLNRLSAEHGVLSLEADAPEICVGNKINFIVGYEDLTIFLHDQLFGIRHGKVEVVWDILGRGRLS